MPTINQVIDRYQKGAELLAQAVKGAPPSLLDRSPAPGKWSIRQIAVHLADSEIMGAGRLRAMAAQPGFPLTGYDQDQWAAKLGYPKRNLKEAVELFRLLRESTANVLRLLPKDAFSNKAIHSEQGEVTLLPYLEHYAQHAENHARQIRDIRARFEAKPKAKAKARGR